MDQFKMCHSGIYRLCCSVDAEVIEGEPLFRLSLEELKRGLCSGICFCMDMWCMWCVCTADMRNERKKIHK